MPRKSVHSTTIVQAVRRYFGLEQQELAAYLGIGRAGCGSARAGSAAFLANVDAEQVAAQVANITATQTAVTTHRATLMV